MKQVGIEPQIIKRTVIALYEAEVNIVAHADKGSIKIDLEPDFIHMILEDEGPGIADIDLAMQKGYSTASPMVRQIRITSYNVCYTKLLRLNAIKFTDF